MRTHDAPRQLEDRALLTDQDRQQIESLYRRYGKGVGSYVLTRTGDRELAESITARVFLIVVRRFEQCTGNPVAWLWSIVRTELARHFRDRKVTEPLDVEPPDNSREPSMFAERAEIGERMRRALGQLGEPAHTLVYMKFFLDMSNTDIAETLGMTPGNVGVTAHRALKRLKELLEEKVVMQDLQPAFTPSPGTPGEGWGGGRLEVGVR